MISVFTVTMGCFLQQLQEKSGYQKGTWFSNGLGQCSTCILSTKTYILCDDMRSEKNYGEERKCDPSLAPHWQQQIQLTASLQDTCVRPHFPACKTGIIPLSGRFHAHKYIKDHEMFQYGGQNNIKISKINQSPFFWVLKSESLYLFSAALSFLCFLLPTMHT